MSGVHCCAFFSPLHHTVLFYEGFFFYPGYLDSGATGGERHDADDVSTVGGEGAGVIQELQVAHVNAWHGGLFERHFDLVGGATNAGVPWQPQAKQNESLEKATVSWRNNVSHGSLW